MLSELPEILLSGSSFTSGFPTWELHEPSFIFHDDPVVFTPQSSHVPIWFGSENPIPHWGSNEPDGTINSSSGSDAFGRSVSKKIRSNSGASSRLGPDIDERKRRRMISNRESARRSRIRKQKHVENLMNQVNRLKVGNGELMNRLRLVVHQTQLVCAENEYLRSEAAVLRQRLWDIRQVLIAGQLVNPSCINNQGLLPLQSLIT
ncbi:hypothetical protein OROGR_028580 [Orobanche gracilis]